MGAIDNRIDAYIEKSQDFAKPILEHIRNLVHSVCPEVEEDMKWSFPHFMYNKKILCSVAAFKQHCAFGFWLEKEMKTMKELTKDTEKNSMFSLGKIQSVSDLPSDVQLSKAVREAMELTDMGVVVKKAAPQKVELETPDYFMVALKENKNAFNFFNKASMSYRKEYITWIVDAKTEATRNKRITQAIEWISEGKGRNWKYEKC